MPSLLFVYNADSGLFNTLSDIAHKLFLPDTYACGLCRITHGTIAMRRDWKRFLENLEMPLEFLHRDEFAGRYGITDMPLPAVLLHDGAALKTLVDADAINACSNSDELQQLLTARLARARNLQQDGTSGNRAG
jgi:hypothetical protein